VTTIVIITTVVIMAMVVMIIFLFFGLIWHFAPAEVSGDFECRTLYCGVPSASTSEARTKASSHQKSRPPRSYEWRAHVGHSSGLGSRVREAWSRRLFQAPPADIVKASFLRRQRGWHVAARCAIMEQLWPSFDTIAPSRLAAVDTHSAFLICYLGIRELVDVHGRLSVTTKVSAGNARWSSSRGKVSLFERRLAMSFKILMLIKALVCLAFAPLLLLLPSQLLTVYGMTFSSGAALTARAYGASLLGNLMLAWFARNAEESPVRRAIVLDLFVYDLVALLATVALLLSGTMNVLGWSIAVIYLFFTVGFGYFLLRRKKAA
jgi:hypothetical protein